jgi:prepilin peptidase CpaA
VLLASWFFAAFWVLWLAVVAWMDFRYRKVRNWMVLAGMLLGLVALISGHAPYVAGWMEPVFGALLAFAVLLPFYGLQWVGAGDVKFFAVAGLWLGVSESLLAIWIGASVLAAIHAMCAVIRLAKPSSKPLSGVLDAAKQDVSRVQMAGPEMSDDVRVKRTRRRSIPYAGYMAIVAIWVAWRNWPMLH